jgi:hypothetical protein
MGALCVSCRSVIRAEQHKVIGEQKKVGQSQTIRGIDSVQTEVADNSEGMGLREAKIYVSVRSRSTVVEQVRQFRRIVQSAMCSVPRKTVELD